MPELPEVETVLSGLKQVMMTQKISDVEIFTPKLRVPIPADLKEKICNREIISMTRRAKYMLINFTGNQTVIVHLGMTGVFRVIPFKSIDTENKKHDHIQIKLNNGTKIIYNDARRFGVVDVMETTKILQTPYLKNLGLEPLSKNFTARWLLNELDKKSCAIKQTIMDQKLIVGVGNIYASEALFHAGIDPEKPASQLTENQAKLLVSSIKAILKKAIKAGGSTLRDYRNVGGERGYFQTFFSVYDREGQPCPQCDCNIQKTGGIKRIVQGGRSTFYCPQKQA